jgi:hypothetical protein
MQIEAGNKTHILVLELFYILLKLKIKYQADKNILISN